MRVLDWPKSIVGSDGVIAPAESTVLTVKEFDGELKEKYEPVVPVSIMFADQ